MRITILAIGTRGDVQPCIALGLGLLSAGHQITVAAFSDFQEMIAASGLRYAEIRGSMRDLVQTDAAREIARSGNNLVKATRLMAEILETLTSRLCENLLQACRGAEAVIFSTAAPHGYHLYAIPEALGIPCVAAYLFPMFGYTRSFPHPLWPFDVHLAGVGSWVSNIATQQLIWQPFRKTINTWRQDVLKLQPVPFMGPYRSLHQRPILYGYSPSVIPSPPRSVDWAHVTGFWFLDHAPGWTPPPALKAFIEAGPPPVYIGFGSVNSNEAEQVLKVATEALKQSGNRGVLLSESTEWESVSSDDVFLTDGVPFDWLFPHVGAVVHHGGAGTTAAALRAGVPSVVVPFKGEQVYFGRVVERAGAGPALIKRTELSAERLAAAIRTAMTDQSIRNRARLLGKQIRAEDGVGEAVRTFEMLMTSGKFTRDD